MKNDEIAIIGMSGRFPGADSIDALWENSLNQKCTIKHFSENELSSRLPSSLTQEKNYIRAKGIINQVDQFDPEFFNLSDQEATLTDPQHRLFLLCAYEALTDANIVPNKKNTIGVFAATGISHYLYHYILNNPDIRQTADDHQILIGNDKDFLATKVGYHFNLQGPCINVQTGCSSSLVAVHYACESILRGECEAALVGGVSITLPQHQGYVHKKNGIGSADGYCIPFDANASGTVKSNAVGVVILKSLSQAIKDGDTIYAVIKGSAVNNDGNDKVGFTAPSVNQQCNVILSAIENAQVSVDAIDYIETHGTGTELGDPIEIAALKLAFAQRDISKPCYLTALKSNLGHVDVAAGVVALIRAALAIQNKKMPAVVGFKNLNPKIKLQGSCFEINCETREWSNETRIAGVSAFGVGGTNAHVIIGNAPSDHFDKVPASFDFYQFPDVPTSSDALLPFLHRRPAACPRDPENLLWIPRTSRGTTVEKGEDGIGGLEFSLWLFSAKSKVALKSSIYQLANNHESKNDWHTFASNVATTLTHRKPYAYRLALTLNSFKDFTQQIQQINFEAITPIKRAPKIIFLFSGQGTQYCHMSRELYFSNPIFKKYFDACHEIFLPHCDIKFLLHENTNEDVLRDTTQLQPALFALEYALANTFIEMGIQPNALIGHSLGEYVAAVIANIFDLPTAAELIIQRATLIQSLNVSGKMLLIYSSLTEVKNILPPSLDISLENAPQMTVVSGLEPDVVAFAQVLTQRNIHHKILKTSQAFHSRLLDPILNDYKKIVSATLRNKPTIPIISNVTGSWLTDEEALSANYWVKHMRDCVYFNTGLETLLAHQQYFYIEIGPGRSLQSILMQKGIRQSVNTLPQSEEKILDGEVLNLALKKCWENGIYFKLPSAGKKIHLKNTAWNLKRCWVTEPEAVTTPQNKMYTVSTEDVKTILSNTWKKVLGNEPTQHSNFFNEGGTSLLAVQFIDLLPEHLQTKINIITFFQHANFSDLLKHIEQNHLIIHTHRQDDEALLMQDEEI